MLCSPVRAGFETLGVQLCAHCMEDCKVHAPDRDARQSAGKQRFGGAQFLIGQIELGPGALAPAFLGQSGSPSR